jgi:hypothetical protein
MRNLFLCLGGFVSICAAVKAGAQLRPLDPSPFEVYVGGYTFSAQLGASHLNDQRASLAGTEGSLSEIGHFEAAWRSGRVIIEAGGTAQRYFDEKRRFAEPYSGVETSADGKRHDSGDYRIATIVSVTPRDWPVNGILRFGTRLPTTDNTVGLDRDAIDFFTTVGASGLLDRLSVSAEAGLGIHGTRETAFEQDDLFLYSIRAEYPLQLTPSLTLVGQKHGTGHSEIRGVEDLGEVRVGLRAGNRNWIRAEFVKGYEPFSPSAGFIVTAGIFR